MYGSYAPGAPNVFLDDAQWKEMWPGPERVYIVADDDQRPRFEKLAGKEALFTLVESGGKMVLTNQPVPLAAAR